MKIVRSLKRGSRRLKATGKAVNDSGLAAGDWLPVTRKCHTMCLLEQLSPENGVQRSWK